MRCIRLFAAAGLLAAAALFGATLNSDEYLSFVKFLASEDMKGRATGSPELERAAAYIAGRFQKFGLKPVQANSYYQDFDVTTAAHLGTHGSFDWSGGTLKLQADYVPLNLSAKGEVKAPLVFAGYGITAPEYHYDDYANIDAKDKIVLVLRHEPQEFDEKSVFDGKVYTAHAQIFSKASNAKIHGARAVILVNDVAAHPNDPDRLDKFGATAGPDNAGIEFVQVRAEVAKKWFELAGKSMDQIERDIDQNLQPQSFAFPNSLKLDLDVDIEREVKQVHNVVGYLPGETDEYVIVGAHYDHLGLGEHDSLAPSMAGTVHPGADDNASGTAGVLELAHYFSGEKKHKRGLVFMTFAGEELGLLGSNYYANHPELPLSKAVTMINLDMIGRLRDNKVYVGGAGSGTTLLALVNDVAPKHGMQVDISEKAGYGSSDHTSFTTKQVPVLFFFSGLHADYHKPSDTWDKIDAPGSVKLLGMVSDVMEHLADDPGRPAFVRVIEQNPRGGDTSGSVGKSVYGPDFGSIPDFTELPNGVRFADIRPGSPAAKAGLKAGDILTEFDGKPIQNLYDFTYALRAKKPGDEVLVRVLRDGKSIEAKVLLTARK